MEDSTYWKVKLNNGEIKTQSNEYKWQDLRKYIYENDLYIDEMSLCFRDHIVSLPEKARGYFFSFAIGGDVSSQTFNFYIVGILNENNKFERIWFYVPELEIHTKDVKEIEKLNPESIIYNYTKEGLRKI